MQPAAPGVRSFRQILIVFLAAVALPAYAQATNAFDEKVMDLVQQSRSPFLDRLMPTLSSEWNRENFILISLPVIVMGDEKSYRCFELGLKAMILADGSTSILKYTTNRKRPSGSHSRWNSSFPSSHASTSFAFAWAVSREYPSLKIPSLVLASLISYSRVYLKRHYPTDVIFGACLGILCCEIAQRYLSRIHIDRDAVAGRIPVRIRIVPTGHGGVKVIFSIRRRH